MGSGRKVELSLGDQPENNSNAMLGKEATHYDLKQNLFFHEVDTERQFTNSSSGWILKHKLV